VADGLVATLKERHSLLDVVDMLGLADSRKGYKVQCPLHDDNEPSLHLYVDQDRWQCFVCDVGGDQLDLLAAVWELPLAQTIEQLARADGLDPVTSVWVTKPRAPSPTDMVLRVAAKTHGEVLRSLQADFPSSRGRDAWVPLVEAAFWHYDEILRLFRNKELSPETTYELLLIWWHWMVGQQTMGPDLKLLWSTIGDDRFWRPVKEVAKAREQPEQEAGDQRRGAGGTDAPRAGVQRVPAAQQRQQRPGGRRSLQPRRRDPR
jgi:hypothetical protein